MAEALPAPAERIPRIAPAPELNVAARPPSTFSQLYSDKTKDPSYGRYQRLMARFDADAANAVLGATLLQQVVHLGGTVPQAYLCCGRRVAGPRIFCLHMPKAFIESLSPIST
jgi:hypothetical protein